MQLTIACFLLPGSTHLNNPHQTTYGSICFLTVTGDFPNDLAGKLLMTCFGTGVKWDFKHLMKLFQETSLCCLIPGGPWFPRTSGRGRSRSNARGAEEWLRLNLTKYSHMLKLGLVFGDKAGKAL